MGDYQKLEVWRRAQALAADIHEESRRMPRGNAELADQLRRATLSIPTNLAEGAARNRDPEFLQFITVAIGSAAEAESLLTHAQAVRALDSVRGQELHGELTIVRKMLYRLRHAINARGVAMSGGVVREPGPLSNDEHPPDDQPQTIIQPS